MNDKLRLKKERLAELTTDDLHRVAGGAQKTLLDCLSIKAQCGPSVDMCTTAMSCGCQPTWNCA